MRSMLRRLLYDEAGFIVSSELVLVATVAVVGMIVGMTSIRDHVVQELGDVSAAVSDVNQSYYWAPVAGHHAWVAGSGFFDEQDDCDEWGDPPHTPPAGIRIHDAPYPYVWWENRGVAPPRGPNAE